MAFIKKYALSILLFFVGIGIGFILDNDTANLPIQVREDNSGYKFINPLLFIQYDNVQNKDYESLNGKIKSYIDKATDEGKITDASVYFRIGQSNSVSVYPEKTYSPSSMLKVVNLVSALRVAESDPSFINKPVTISSAYTQYLQNGDRYAPKNPVKIGGTYTIKELMEHVAVESDNVANQALKNAVGKDRVAKTYEDLNMPQVDVVADRGYTPEYYSHLFRALYNGTYLSKPISEKILELLSKAAFKQGLVAGVPEGTAVSHKFGVNAFTVGPYAELHDCGLVYYPKNPYFVCIMTRGKDLSALETVIKDISQITWEHVDSVFER